MEGMEPSQDQQDIRAEVEGEAHYDGENQMEKQGHYYDSIEGEEFEMPDVFEVETRLADNQVKIVTVQVEKFKGEKPFIGGFRSTSNGVAYHNAFSQTDQ